MKTSKINALYKLIDLLNTRPFRGFASRTESSGARFDLNIEKKR